VTHSILSDKQRTLTLDLILRFGSKIKQLNGSDSSGVGYDTQAIAEVSVITNTASAEYIVRCSTVSSRSGAKVSGWDVVGFVDADASDLRNSTLSDASLTSDVRVNGRQKVEAVGSVSTSY
jgi:hypothetical protein